MIHSNPNFGIIASPNMGFGDVHTQKMKIREVLALNFKTLRGKKPQLNKLGDITKAGGGTNGTLGRIAKGDVGVSIDLLEPLARVYGVEPWQLLAADLGGATDGGNKHWPFTHVTKARWDSLTIDQQEGLEIMLLNAIRGLEGKDQQTKQLMPETGVKRTA